MFRPFVHLATGLGLSAGAVAFLAVSTAVTSSAQAADITNPAQHPYPVTITIDGQTYHDGLDTLPGYDDVACTAIPNVQYDFADNEIDYYDDNGNLLKTAPWTEWSRITSYQTWLKQQQGAGSSSSGTGSSGSTSSSKGSSGTSKSSSSSKSSSTTKSGTSKPSSSKSSSTDKTGTDKSGSTTPEASASASPSDAATDAASASASAPATATDSASAKKGSSLTVTPAAVDPSTGATAPASASTLLVSQSTEKLAGDVSAGLGAGAGNTRFGGVVVLAGLGAAALGVLAASAVRTRLRSRRRVGSHV